MMLTLKINLYSFDELREAAQKRAIDDQRRFLLDMMTPSDFISGDPQYDTPEELQKVYEAEYNNYSENDEPIIESLAINEYLFYYNGEICPSVTYTGGERKGTTEIRVHGELFIL